MTDLNEYHAQANETFIAFYLRDYKFRVFTKSLRDIGMPYYVRFLANPDKAMLVMQAYDKKELTSFKVSRKVFLDSRSSSLRIGSKPFCSIIAKMMGWDMNHSYRIPGIIYPNQHLVQFDLSKAFQYEADLDY